MQFTYWEKGGGGWRDVFCGRGEGRRVNTEKTRRDVYGREGEKVKNTAFSYSLQSFFVAFRGSMTAHQNCFAGIFFLFSEETGRDVCWGEEA